jgi:para-nitrobenzyl esterase
VLAMQQPVVTTASGRVRGFVSGGVAGFLGVPYADAPIGPLRFQAPVPPLPWDGVRDAVEFGPTPPKPAYAPPIDQILLEREVPGEGWLNLNVWTPEHAWDSERADGLPVMVWIHGGAFANGNSSLPVYDGTAFARDGVVLVSVNYRLGVDGFAYLPDAPANRGLLDQIAALEWVRDNIAAFGGDPDNVTIFGESAGAMSVTLLMTIPRARGLFAKAITQSGSVQAAATVDDAALVSGELARVLGLPATAEALAKVEIADLLAAQRAVANALIADRDPARFGESVVRAAMAFIPVIDGDLVPEHPMTAIASGAAAGVPLLTGTTADEYRLFLVPSGLAAAMTDDMLTRMSASMGVPVEVSSLYRANRPKATPGDVFAALLTDVYFRGPGLATADAHRGPSYVYEFAQRTSVGDLWACHGLEVAYVFDTLYADGCAAMCGSDPSPAVATAMHAAWVAFAATGDPGWPRYDGSRPVMVFEDPAPHLELDPRGDERLAWAIGA